MKKLQVVAGILLILHGLAHASAGMWATDIGGHSLVTVLWELATLGFMAAGAGLTGIAVLRDLWRWLIAIASISSLTLLLLYGHPLFVVGIAGDFAAIALAIVTIRISREAHVAPAPGLAWRAVLIALIVYTGIIIGLRPWYSTWGTTKSERQMVMIGDPPIGQSHYRIDHAVTINAPVDSVWPWLIQIGQDRGGFYSYDWLERAFGADIRNANTIVPAWQTRNPGEIVRVVQPTFLGGILGRNVGFPIREIQSGRALVLENWGAFVLDPLGPRTTRMHIRTRGEGVPTVSGIAITPAALLIFEPIHFIMERGMLLGLKQRAENPPVAANSQAQIE
jgi:hypothetical protein